MEWGVLQPLQSLIVLCDGPQKVIAKRRDKHLDFDRLTARVKGLPDSELTSQVSPQRPLGGPTELLASRASGSWLILILSCHNINVLLLCTDEYMGSVGVTRG